MEAQLQKLKVTELKELLAKHSLVQTGKKEDLVKRLLDNNVSIGDGAAAEEKNVDATPVESETTATAPAETAPPSITPEQRRAERFGIPLNTNAEPKSRPKPASEPKDAPKKAESAPKSNGSGIDKNPLGLSDEVLAQRAAKFGLPEKKKEAKPDAPAVKPTPAPVSKAEVELTPEMKEKIAIEEEKKRKRAEKFGTATKPTEEPDAKKTKVGE
ncbi:SAP domain-containing ribonucleoprotein, partial [Tremellales sp. Uapishka_1]